MSLVLLFITQYFYHFFNLELDFDLELDFNLGFSQVLSLRFTVFWKEECRLYYTAVDIDILL